MTALPETGGFFRVFVVNFCVLIEGVADSFIGSVAGELTDPEALAVIGTNGADVALKSFISIGAGSSWISAPNTGFNTEVAVGGAGT